MSKVSSPLAYPQVLRNLARLVTQQIGLGESKALIQRRLATREERFLRFVARYIYGYPRSPYLPLLAHAGAELGCPVQTRCLHFDTPIESIMTHAARRLRNTVHGVGVAVYGVVIWLIYSKVLTDLLRLLHHALPVRRARWLEEVGEV